VLQVAEKNGEAMKPCKRRKSRPLVDAVERTKYGSVSTSTTSSPSSILLLSSPVHSCVNDLSASDSVGSASDSTHVSEQNSAGVVSTVYTELVKRCALDAAVSDMNDCVPSSNDWKDVTFQHEKQSLIASDSEPSIADRPVDTSLENCVRSCGDGLERRAHCDANDLNQASAPV